MGKWRISTEGEKPLEAMRRYVADRGWTVLIGPLPAKKGERDQRRSADGCRLH